MGKKRRAVRGDGSIFRSSYKRKDGTTGVRWVAQIAYVDWEGRRVRKSVSGSTADEARRKRDELKRKIEAGFAVERDVNLRRLMEMWLDTSRAIQETTLDFYKGVIRNSWSRISATG